MIERVAADRDAAIIDVGAGASTLVDGLVSDGYHRITVLDISASALERARYVAQLRRALRPHGHAIVATFAEDGPIRCSGLDIVRYSPNALQREFGDDFRLVTSSHEMHRTPWAAEQAFTYCVLKYEPIGIGCV